MQLRLPLTNPVLVFARAMGIFLAAPLIRWRYAVPGIIAAGSEQQLVAELGGRGSAGQDLPDSMPAGDRG